MAGEEGVSKYSSTLSLTAALSVGGQSVACHSHFSLVGGPQVQSVWVQNIRTLECSATASPYTNYAIQTPSLCVNDN